MTRKKKHDAETEAEEIAEAVEAEELAKESESDDITNPNGTPPPPEPPPAPPPDWVAKAKPISAKTADANAAWHDFFKEPLPTTPPIAKWSGNDATYSQFEGGRVLAEYREGGWFSVLTTPPPPKKPAARR